MGATRVDVTVRNPAAPERAWEGVFLVDTGCSDCIVAGKHLETIGLVPQKTRDYELADGSILRFEVARAELAFMGESVSVDVVFGNDDAEPLLGFIALEAARMEVDPVDELLKPRRAGYMVSLRRVED